MSTLKTMKRKLILKHIDAALEFLNGDVELKAAAHLTASTMILSGCSPKVYITFCRKADIKILNWATGEWEK
jgi:hypothetical protein